MKNETFQFSAGAELTSDILTLVITIGASFYGVVALYSLPLV